jgi:hypothetical protein
MDRECPLAGIRFKRPRMTIWRTSATHKNAAEWRCATRCHGLRRLTSQRVNRFARRKAYVRAENVTRQSSPGVGKQATYSVDAAGTVTLLERSTTMLQITDADGNAGWTANILTASGTKVHVGFQQVDAPEEQERFWARLNTKGTAGAEAILVLQSCA